MSAIPIVPVPFSINAPMTMHCALGFCSASGPCDNSQCGCECHDEDAQRDNH